MSRYDYSGSDEFRPLSPWGYVGYTILFSIPIVGFIFLIVLTFSRSNINRRSFARSYWCWLLMTLIITVIVAFVAVAGLKLDFIPSSGNEIIDKVKTFVTNALKIDDSRIEEEVKMDGSGTEEKKGLLSSVIGVTPEFRAAMDSYEAFFDEYIAFMKKFENDKTDLNLLIDYATFMTRYADMTQKMDAIEETQLSVADDAYYLKVTTRIYLKLAEISAQ